jgi:hypothetical protein
MAGSTGHNTHGRQGERGRDGLNVGISISVSRHANIWANGINQNIAFLVQTLQAIPFVHHVWLLNGGDHDSLPEEMNFAGIDVPLVRPGEVTHDIDVVIEMGAILDGEWMAHVHALGARIIAFGVGHNYVAVNETILFGRPGGMVLSDPAIRSETWGLPQHAKTCSPMLRTMTRGPVLDMPHLWSPHFLDQVIAKAAESGFRFGFDPASAASGWRIGIFEPNISVGKNCLIPMLVCEAAHRIDPSSVERLMVMCSFQMKEHPTFLNFALNLDLNREGKTSYEPRLQFSNCMCEHQLNAVVTHHWEWGQNYLYYDALHGGYPLFHNSEWLRDAGVGFYYPGFTAAEGGQSLILARKHDPAFWEDYRARSAAFLHTLSPLHPDNIAAFSERLVAVTGITP